MILFMGKMLFDGCKITIFFGSAKEKVLFLHKTKKRYLSIPLLFVVYNL